MSELPSDNMHNILSRIPVKSLARMRRVSDHWRNFINNPHLETMHAKRAASTAPTLIMFHQNPSHCPNSPCTLTFLERNEISSNTCTREVTKKPQAMEFMCTNTSSRYPNGVILGSCNGLMYSSQRYPDSTTLVVIHPLTL
ncbi:F-box protein At3g07870-like [Bidens hawaiensis]|uniref:F-box protein At3g07870-like n=1 Tax=Bidens hawaiensis TaxID=980011 RepID=UPI00404A3319